MSLESGLFLIVIAAGIIGAARRVYSEKRPARGRSTGVGVDASTFDGTNDAFPGDSAMHHSSHTSGCEVGDSHDVGTADCGHGGFDGGGHH